MSTFCFGTLEKERKMSNHERILRQRYNHILKSLADVDPVLDTLLEKGILTLSEKWEISRGQTLAEQKQLLCQVLTSRGIARLVEIIKILQENAQTWKQLQERDVRSSASSQSEVTSYSGSVLSEGRSEGGGGGGGAHRNMEQ